VTRSFVAKSGARIGEPNVRQDGRRQKKVTGPLAPRQRADIFSVLTFLVQQRAREFSVRLATEYAQMVTRPRVT
jgi:hypothetical protein